MPRHSIRTPKTPPNLSGVFVEADDLPEQVSSDSVFGNDLPLEIEIGSGKGLFLATTSVSNPAHNYLGIEIISKYAKHAAARLIRSGTRDVGNARMVAGNAEPIFQSRVQPGSLEAVHVYFPDPWWKKKHRKRRVVNEKSLLHYAQSIRVGGRFHFWTDVLDYFEDTVEMIADLTPNLGVPIPEEEIQATHDLDYRTHFERRSRKHRIPVYRVRYEKLR